MRFFSIVWNDEIHWRFLTSKKRTHGIYVFYSRMNEQKRSGSQIERKFVEFKLGIVEERQKEGESQEESKGMTQPGTFDMHIEILSFPLSSIKNCEYEEPTLILGFNWLKYVFKPTRTPNNFVFLFFSLNISFLGPRRSLPFLLKEGE